MGPVLHGIGPTANQIEKKDDAMSRHPVERHNDEFRLLFDRVVDTFEGRGKVNTAMELSAKMLGVKPETIKSWLRPEGGKTSYACPKWRVDMYRLAIDKWFNLLSGVERKNIFISLKALRDAGIMSEPTAKAFDKLARAHKRVAQ